MWGGLRFPSSVFFSLRAFFIPMTALNMEEIFTDFRVYFRDSLNFCTERHIAFCRQARMYFFTLFLGYLAFCLINRFKENPTMQLMSMLVLLAVSYFLKADYGYKGYVFLLIMFWLHQYKPAQALIGSCWLIYEWKACFAFISLNMYNGKRGIRGKWAKYFLLCILPGSYCNINNHTQKGSKNLTESSKSPAGVAKSNKQWVGTCLYQEECSSSDKLRSSYSVMSKVAKRIANIRLNAIPTACLSTASCRDYYLFI